MRRWRLVAEFDLPKEAPETCIIPDCGRVAIALVIDWENNWVGYCGAHAIADLQSERGA